jgi:hypothetical protein
MRQWLIHYINIVLDKGLTVYYYYHYYSPLYYYFYVANLIYILYIL